MLQLSGPPAFITAFATEEWFMPMAWPISCNSHVFHYYALTAQTAAAMDWALVNVYQPIRDLYVYWTATYGNADVIVFDLYWGDGPIGWVDCPRRG
jgi:hypothetical protein